MTPAVPGSGIPVTYEFRIQDHLDDRWARWFDGLTLTREPDGTTTLRGAVADQAALHGVLNNLRDLGTTLISMQVLEALEQLTGDERSELRRCQALMSSGHVQICIRRVNGSGCAAPCHAATRRGEPAPRWRTS